MARRAHGEGTIRQISEKLWRARISLGSTELHKRQRKDLYGQTRVEVTQKLREFLREKDLGVIRPNSAKTVAEFFDQWMITLKRGENSTYDDYERVYRLHIKPIIGKVQLAKITPDTIEAFHRELDRSKSQQSDKTKALGDRTKRKAHNLLSQGLNLALRANLIVRNPCDIVDTPKYHPKEMKTLTMQQLHLLLEQVKGTRLHPICALGAFCGLREGEVFALRWSDIDFTAKRVNVMRSARTVSGKASISKTKTKAGKRGVVIPEPALESLKWWKAQGSSDPNGLVFPNAAGKQMNRHNFIQRDYHPALKGAGLPPIRFHDLRHSVATYYLSIGVNPKVVQEILGHSHVSTTLAIYSHALPTMQTDAADLLATAFSSAKPEIEGGIIGGTSVLEAGRKIKKP